LSFCIGIFLCAFTRSLHYERSLFNQLPQTFFLLSTSKFESRSDNHPLPTVSATSTKQATVHWKHNASIQWGLKLKDEIRLKR
jgi:hypothetical protein